MAATSDGGFKGSLDKELFSSFIYELKLADESQLPPLTTIIPAYTVVQTVKWITAKWIQVGRASGDWMETACWNWRLETGSF